MKVVLDTNVFISALVFNKKIQTLLETLLEDHTIIISPFILEELAEKLTTKFNLNDSDVNFLIKQLMELTSVVFLKDHFPMPLKIRMIIIFYSLQNLPKPIWLYQEIKISMV